jgi:hypothetical protein
VSTQDLDFRSSCEINILRNRSTSTTSSAAVTFTPIKKLREDTSGLTPIEVGITLALLLGVFILLIIVGELCKIFNKPKTKALPYVSGQKQKLFQPSAAGYGTRVAAGQSSPEGKNQYSSRAGLMAAASPMGRGGRPDWYTWVESRRYRLLWQSRS